MCGEHVRREAALCHVCLCGVMVVSSAPIRRRVSMMTVAVHAHNTMLRHTHIHPRSVTVSVSDLLTRALSLCDCDVYTATVKENSISFPMRNGEWRNLKINKFSQ